MKVHQELKIQLLDSVEYTLAKFTPSQHWQRNVEKEKKLIDFFPPESQICFYFSAKPELSSSLWLIEKSDNLSHYLQVTNIIPERKTELSIDEYNGILQNFVDCNLKGSGLQHELSKADVSLLDLLSDESCEKFTVFSTTSNKTTGRLHPSDEEKWFEFIYSTLMHDEYLHPNDLQYFLIEDGWDKSTAFELSLDYEYGYNAMKYRNKCEAG